jgi:hypothetical protein
LSESYIAQRSACDYFFIFYAAFYQKIVKDTITGLDLVAWDTRTPLDDAIAGSLKQVQEIFEQVDALAQQHNVSLQDFLQKITIQHSPETGAMPTQGWFDDACNRITAMTQFMTERYGTYPALLELIKQENAVTKKQVRDLLSTITGDTHCENIIEKFITYLKQNPIDFDELITIISQILDLQDQIVDPLLLHSILTDNHDLILVHGGTEHVSHIKHYLEAMGYDAVTSTYRNQSNDVDDPTEPLAPEVITQALEQAMTWYTSTANTSI